MLCLGCYLVLLMLFVIVQKCGAIFFKNIYAGLVFKRKMFVNFVQISWMCNKCAADLVLIALTEIVLNVKTASGEEEQEGQKT